ncbi:hypothetical protein GF312_02180, partial [Candidatus Poribacteria bacterium]|nr:hypothetical protein [Candidatus Poribacteria bacterium]
KLMTFLVTFTYMFFLTACGCFLIKRFKLNPLIALPVGFLAGSVFVGIIMFILVSVKLVSWIPVILLLIAISLVGIFGLRYLLYSGRENVKFLRKDLYKGRYKLILLLLLILGLLLQLACAYTPPRSADAMRYHLAQVKDTVNHSGFVFRPYYHYNFPQYFHYIFIPVYMLVGGTGIKLAVYIYFVLVLFITIHISYSTEKIKNLSLLALFIVYTPLCFQEATIVTNDFPMIFYVLLGILLIINYKTDSNKIYLVLSYISLGFALGIKYQAILYFPIYMLVTYWAMRDKEYSFKEYMIIIPLVIIALVIASPFLIRNTYYTGDPFWPLMQDIFRVEQDYLYEVTHSATSRMQGKISITSIGESIISMAKYWHIIPLTWLLWLLYLFIRRSLAFPYRAITIVYLVFWYILQPKLYPRFALYIFPIVAIMVVSFCEWSWIKNSIAGRVSYILLGLCILAGLGFAIIYSLDFLEYHINRDIDKYHQATWLYPQYKWINRNIRDNKKILVIVGSAHTYYLDLPYLRADPELSGLIDWNSVNSVEELKFILHNLQVDYIFYDDRNWKHLPGGENMAGLIHALKDSEGVSVMMQEDVKLITLRVLRRYIKTRVLLLKIEDMDS